MVRKSCLESCWNVSADRSDAPMAKNAGATLGRRTMFETDVRSGYQVNVQMGDRLARVRSRVDDDAVA